MATIYVLDSVNKQQRLCSYFLNPKNNFAKVHDDATSSKVNNLRYLLKLDSSRNYL
jgi:hypothetical protein